MEVKLKKCTIGRSRPVFVVAEMSGNHGGKIERALEIVRAAARAGADAIKLQTYTADTITLNCNSEDFQIPFATPWSSHKTLWELYRAAFTPWEWHPIIFNEARALGLDYFSSPFDESAVDFLEDLDVSAYKIASPEITHVPLLKRVARTGRPVIISTGVADLKDIELAISTLRNSGSKEIIVLKCNTSYPAPIEESNLLTIKDIPERFGVLSGLSDHSMGTLSALLAVSLGASLIEKHFTLDDDVTTVDSFFSAGENEFSRMVRDIRDAELCIGKVSYDISPSSQENIRGRRSVYISTFVKSGELFSTSNTKVIRPSFGLHPLHYEQILGRKARRDMPMGTRLTWDDIE
jgi:pseudaminic acid synthase